MPVYQHFEDLPAWQSAAALYNAVLDFLQKERIPVSSGFRNQLDRAALSVSNNIAEGFERMTTNELIAFLAIARGSASEVRSMVAVVPNRQSLSPHQDALSRISDLAGSCLRQLTAWISSIEKGPVQGKRHLTARQADQRQADQAKDHFRQMFLLRLQPDHPLYHSPEAIKVRQENNLPHSQSLIDDKQS